MPQMSAFTRMRWAVAVAEGHANSQKQVEMPQRWLSALACQEFIPIERKCRRRPKFWTVIPFDWSLTGSGATLQTDTSELNEAHLSLVVAYWVDQWDASDRAAMRASEHDPADQPKVEAYTLLYSIVVWNRVLASAQGNLAIMGGALGIRRDGLKFRAKEPTLKRIVGGDCAADSATGVGHQRGPRVDAAEQDLRRIGQIGTWGSPASDS